MVVLALLLMFAGFVAVAASMERHQQDLGSDTLSDAQLRGWRLGGWLLLALSLWPCFTRWQSVSVSLSAWAGLLTLAGIALGLLFTYSPKGVQGLKKVVSRLAVRRDQARPQAQSSAPTQPPIQTPSQAPASPS